MNRLAPSESSRVKKKSLEHPREIRLYIHQESFLDMVFFLKNLVLGIHFSKKYVNFKNGINELFLKKSLCVIESFIVNKSPGSS